MMHYKFTAIYWSAVVIFILTLVWAIYFLNPEFFGKQESALSERYPEEFKRLGIKGTDNLRELVAALCRLEDRVYVLEQTVMREIGKTDDEYPKLTYAEGK